MQSTREGEVGVERKGKSFQQNPKLRDIPHSKMQNMSCHVNKNILVTEQNRLIRN